MSNPIRFKDFADLSDAKEAAKIFDDLERDVKNSFKGIGDFVKKQLQGVNKSIEELRDTAKELEKTGISGKNAGAISSIAKEYDKVAESQNRVKETLKGLTETEKFAANSIQGLKEQAKKLQAEYNRLVTTENKNSASSKKLATEIRKVKQEAYDLSTETRRINNEFTAVEGSYNSLVLRNKQLGKELRNLPVFLDKSSREFKETAQRARELEKEFADNTARLTQFDKRLNQNFRNVGNYQSALGGMGGSLKSLALNLTGAYLGITGLQQAFRFFISTNAEISDSLADVRKTTGFTDDQVQDLLKTVKQFNTRTSIQGLLDIAKIGGQIGVAGKDIAGFTKAVDVAAVALGDEFSGGIEEISSSLGKINSVYKVTERIGVEEGIINTGSAINALGAAGLATAPYLADFTQRLGGIASNTGQSVQNILGLSAATEELGLTSEVSSSALSQVFNKMSTDTAKFARVAGKDLKEFEALINKDINAAFLQVLEGLQRSSGSTTEFSRAIQSLGLEGARSTSVIASLAGNVDLIREKQALANIEFEKGTSLQEEFNIKNDTFAASLDKLSKSFVSLSTGQNGFSNFLKSSVDEVTKLVQALEFLGESSGLRDFQIRLAAGFSSTGIDDFNEALAKPAELYKEAAKKIKQENDALVQQFVKGGFSIEEAQDKALVSQIGSLEKVNKQLEDLEGRIKYQRQVRDATDRQSESYQDQKEKVEALYEQRRNLRAQIEYFTSLQKAGTEATQENNAAFEEGKEAVSDYAKELENLKNKYREFLDELQSEDINKKLEFDGVKMLDEEMDKERQRYIDQAKFLSDLDNDAAKEIESRYGREEDLAQKSAEKQAEIYKERVEAEIEYEKYLQDRKRELQEDAYYASRDLINALAESYIAKGDEQIKNLETEKEREIEILEASKAYQVSTTEQQERAKASITEKYARQTAEIRRNQARQEKALAIFNIALDTAAAIINQLSVTPLPAGAGFVAAIAAIGAIQAAAVASKPLPAFEKGTKNAPEGPAWVGEKGWEFIERKGRLFQTNDGPQIMPLQRGDKVYTHNESERMLKDAEKAIQMQFPLKTINVHEQAVRNTQRNEPIKEKKDKGTDKIIRAIKSQPIPSLAREADKIVEVIEYKNHRKIYLSKRRR